MKNMTIFILFLFIFSNFASAQKKIYYLNIDSVNLLKEQFRKIGFSVDFAPRLFFLDKNETLKKVVDDFSEYYRTYYVQIKDIKLLDVEEFNKLPKKHLRIQKLQYIQSKLNDYKWDGSLKFELPNIGSTIFYTVKIFEYSDKYILDVDIAEKKMEEIIFSE